MCKEHQDLQLSMNLINFFIFFKTPPKVKKEDPLKIPFKSLEARMKWDSRPKQKQDTTRRIDTIHMLPGSLPPCSPLLTQFVFMLKKKDRLKRHKHNLHVVTYQVYAF